MAGNRPLAFVDLDDTLFQTARKMDQGPTSHPASYDIKGDVSGYQTDIQRELTTWLLRTTDVVPVTARSAEAFSRVRLGFNGAAICCHGGLMLNPDRTVNARWHEVMKTLLADYHDRLPDLCEAALQIGARYRIALRGWVVEEAGQRHYVVIKHNDGSDADLALLLNELRSSGVLHGMHTHRNGNNLALLPAGLSKRAAVERYLAWDRELHGQRPVLGFGDSITDFGFMDLCHFWATPAESQLAKRVEALLHVG